MEPFHEEVLVFNRAQRRHLQRVIARKARRQAGIVKRRLGLVDHGQQCPRCSMHFLGGSADRCQCKAGSQA